MSHKRRAGASAPGQSEMPGGARNTMGSRLRLSGCLGLVVSGWHAWLSPQLGNMSLSFLQPILAPLFPP